MRATMRFIRTTCCACTLGVAVAMTMTAAPTSAQTPAPAPPPSPASQAPAPATMPAVTVAESASPELVGAISKELSVTPAQAQGGAGALLGLAKSRLKPEEFTKVSSAVPGVDGLIKAAPVMKGMGGMGMGGALGLASVAGSFKQLGLSPDMAGKMVPVLTKFVSGKGGADVGSLLAGALK